VDTWERVKKGTEFFGAGKKAEFADYLRGLRKKDPLAADLLRVMEADFRSMATEALIRGRRLLSKVSGKPRLAGFLFYHLGRAYRHAGEIAASDNYFQRALELSEQSGDREAISHARLMLLFNKLYKAEYESLYSELRAFTRSVVPKYEHYSHYFLAILEIIRGNPHGAAETMDSLLASGKGNELFRLVVMEIRGLAARMLGRLEEATRFYSESARGLLDLGSAYAAFPCAKAMEISRLGGLESPPLKMVRKCIGLARKGSVGEEAAAREIEALLTEDDGEAAAGLLGAAQGYHRGHQPIEAFMAGLLSACLAWRVEGPVFQGAVKFIAPMAPLHPGLAQDPLLGKFLATVKPLLGYAPHGEDNGGIRAHLIGEFRVFVDGRDILARKWGKRKAIRALLYLLLSPKHRIARDHLFYLLWPRKRYDERTRAWLYVAVNHIRKNLGSPDLLTSKHDFYQLEGDILTDLGELENLVCRAEASQDPAEKEELLRRARELAGGELLPEIIDDHYVDEYRLYYDKLRRRVLIG